MNLFKFSQKYLFKYKKYFVLFLIINVISAVISIIMPDIFGKYIDYLLKFSNKNTVYTFTKILLILSVISIVSSYYLGMVATKYQTKAAVDLNFDLLEHVKKLPLSFLNTVDTTYLNQRINSDSNALISFVLNNFINIFIKAGTMIASLYFLFTISLKISIFLFIIIGVYLLVYFVFKKLLYSVNFELVEKQNLFFAKMNEQLYNVKFIKINCLFSELYSKLTSSFNDLFKSVVKFARVSNSYSAFDSIINKAATLLIFFIGGIEIINRRLTIGNYTIINSYFSILLGATSYFLNLGKSYQETKVSYTRTCEILNMSEENNGNIQLNSIDEISINNLCFSYAENQDVIKNFNCNLQKGNIYCLVGENGAGKSTLINIILGLYENYSGQILYNSQDLKNIDLYAVRKLLIGVTEQEPFLINDTIINNLTLGLSENKISGLNEWCNKLEINEWLENLPNGLDTNIYSRCNNLSGGEKQKLSQTRIFIKDPDVLILDEPTSAIDKNSIDRIKEILLTAKKNKIIIIITHDYNFSNIADKIIKIS